MFDELNFRRGARFLAARALAEAGSNAINALRPDVSPMAAIRGTPGMAGVEALMSWLDEVASTDAPDPADRTRIILAAAPMRERLGQGEIFQQWEANRALHPLVQDVLASTARSIAGRSSDDKLLAFVGYFWKYDQVQHDAVVADVRSIPHAREQPEDQAARRVQEREPFDTGRACVADPGSHGARSCVALRHRTLRTRSVASH